MFPIKKVVDLSHPMYQGMPGWPTHPNFTLEMIRYVARDMYSLHVVKMTTHDGTHLDVPSHVIEGGKTPDQYSIDHFMGDGVVLNFSFKKKGEEMMEEELRSFDADIKEGDVVLLHTGWDKKRGLNAEYLYEWPYLGERGAMFLVSKRVKAVGTDGMSIAPWRGRTAAHGPVAESGLTDPHDILLEKDVTIVEEMANMSELLDGNRTARAYIIFAPMPIQGVDGCPTRAFALLS